MGILNDKGGFSRRRFTSMLGGWVRVGRAGGRVGIPACVGVVCVVVYIRVPSRACVCVRLVYKPADGRDEIQRQQISSLRPRPTTGRASGALVVPIETLRGCQRGGHLLRLGAVLGNRRHSSYAGAVRSDRCVRRLELVQVQIEPQARCSRAEARVTLCDLELSLGRVHGGSGGRGSEGLFWAQFELAAGTTTARTTAVL